MKTDILVIGGGLAGLAAACEAAEAGKRVTLVDQEGKQSLGGQAFWSLGGLFFVDSPEQRRMGIKDNHALALSDWMNTAGFDRDEDHWPRLWAEAYVDFAAGEKRAWLKQHGVGWFPVVGWAERGGALSNGHGNSVPRFHVTWGTGPALVAAFVRRLQNNVDAGRITLLFRHRVEHLMLNNGIVTGASGIILAPSAVERGKASAQEKTGDFTIDAQAVIVASGGIGGNLDLVRKNWPQRLGTPPKFMVAGVPAHVDGRMLGVAEQAGANLINRDRMWHYTEGLRNWDCVWDNHGIRILPGPSSLWFDATGKRLAPPCLPGYDTLATLAAIQKTGYDYSWFVLNQRIITKEFALSGSEQNPELTGKDWRAMIRRSIRKLAPEPVEAFKRHGLDFVVAHNLTELVAGMNRLSDGPQIDEADLKQQIETRDRQLDNGFGKDAQIAAIRDARNYRGDRLVRTVAPHRILDPAAGPLIAVRLNILTRKTLGGLQTDLSGRALKADGTPLPGLYAAGEASGFGGGGMHGYRALEGTFLGGCLFSGKTAGIAAANAV